MDPFDDDLDEFPEPLRLLDSAGRELWKHKSRWIHSLTAFREEPLVAPTVDRLKATDPSPIEVISWIRTLFMQAPTGPDCPAIALALDLLPGVAADQSLRSAILPLVSLKGAKYNVAASRAGELRPPDDDGPTYPVTVDDVVVPAVALRVLESLRGLEPPALTDLLHWLNGYWTRVGDVHVELAQLVQRLARAGDQPRWKPSSRIAPAWALEELAMEAPAASDPLQQLAKRIRSSEEEKPSSSNERAGSLETHLKRLPARAPEGPEACLMSSQKMARDRIVGALLGDPPVSVLLVGRNGTGRSTATASVARIVATAGVPVYSGSPVDISSGATYTNELDGRLKLVIDGLARKGGVWVAGDFDRASTLGRHSDSSTNFADRLTRAVADRRIRLLAEVTDGGYARLVRESPRFVEACEIVRLDPPQHDDLLGVANTTLSAAAAKRNLPAPNVSPETLALALEISDAFLPHLSRLTALVRLMHVVIDARDPANDDAISAPELYPALTTITGLPSALVDPTIPLDIPDICARLSDRVMGQARAVETLVERVAMIKAGLAPRDRPNGVFLFVGPSGVGKTELARALAETVFGDAGRLIQIDMSQLDSYSAPHRLLGSDRDRGSSLADEVRRTPFSVVLLDEFEKADQRTWDIFLPVFDTGRVADLEGRWVDFRQTIVICTSNLGASNATRDPVGFAAAERSAFDDRELLTAVKRTLRPELLGRFDRVVSFYPLSREVMAKLIQREIGRVFSSRALRHHQWRVAVDDSAVALLLDHGFASDLGARPLRQAVERLIAAPLAIDIASGRAPATQAVVRIAASRDGSGIQLSAASETADRQAATWPAPDPEQRAEAPTASA